MEIETEMTHTRLSTCTRTRQRNTNLDRDTYVGLLLLTAKVTGDREDMDTDTRNKDHGG